MTEHPRITLVLDCLRSAHNTGNIFRIAEAVGACEVLCCGYTPCPPHPKLAKPAMGTDRIVPFRWFKTSREAAETLRREGFAQILAAEWNASSVPAWRMTYRFPLALILGNEALGVHPDTLQIADGCVGLPMFGQKSSVNVGNAAAAILAAVIASQDCGKKDFSG